MNELEAGKLILILELDAYERPTYFTSADRRADESFYFSCAWRGLSHFTFVVRGVTCKLISL